MQEQLFPCKYNYSKCYIDSFTIEETVLDNTDNIYILYILDETEKSIQG